MEFVLDHASSRARKSRYAAVLRKKGVIVGLALVAIVFEAAGTALLLSGQSVGWVVELPVVIPIMLFFWYRGDLSRIAVGRFETPALVFFARSVRAGNPGTDAT